MPQNYPFDLPGQLDRPHTPLPLTCHSASAAAPKSAESALPSPAAGRGPWTLRCPAGCTLSFPEWHQTAGGSLLPGRGGQRQGGGEGWPLLGASLCGSLARPLPDKSATGDGLRNGRCGRGQLSRAPGFGKPGFRRGSAHTCLPWRSHPPWTRASSALKLSGWTRWCQVLWGWKRCRRAQGPLSTYCVPGPAHSVAASEGGPRPRRAPGRAGKTEVTHSRGSAGGSDRVKGEAEFQGRGVGSRQATKAGCRWGAEDRGGAWGAQPEEGCEEGERSQHV